MGGLSRRPVCRHNGFGRVQGHAGRSSKQEISMWTKPEYTEMRFGFEVTMYIANR
jgi:coenzyme PQQ precursor peptide PqqA